VILIDTNLWLWSVVLGVLPGPDRWSLLRQLLHAVGRAGNLTPDAHLAALAISSNSLLCWADNDFRRFPGLRYLNPLA
jgi:predicted nucleic acid-binding protein